MQTLAKLKAHSDDKFNVTQKIEFLSDRIQSIVGRVENADVNPFTNKPWYLRVCITSPLKKL